MISVPSHRPLLSGSKVLLVILLLLIMVFNSCRIFFPEEEEPVEPEEPEVEEPKEPEEPEEEVDTLDLMFPEIEPDTFRVVYLLPFHFDRDSLNPAQSQLRDISRTFYQGSKVALDTLKECGYNLEVEVLDSRNDTAHLSNLKSRIKEIDPHLIIGPLFGDNLEYLSSFVEENKFNTIGPVANIEECPVDNPYIFYSNPTRKRYGEAAAELANEMYAPIKPVVLRRERVNEARLADYFVEHLDLLVMEDLLEITYETGEWEDDPIDSTKFGEANFVFIPSDHEPFVSTMMTYLQKAGMDYIVVGLDRWQDFSRIDGIVWKNFQVHLLGSYYVDFDQPETIRFTSRYRERFNTEPDEFAFRGFDETRLYINEIVREGVYFQRAYFGNPVMEAIPGIHKSYQFKDRACESWANHYINIMKFEDDYKLHRLDR